MGMRGGAMNISRGGFRGGMMMRGGMISPPSMTIQNSGTRNGGMITENLSSQNLPSSGITKDQKPVPLRV